MSEDMSPYCSAHDEWLIMTLCMYVGYHDANNLLVNLRSPRDMIVLSFLSLGVCLFVPLFASL